MQTHRLTQIIFSVVISICTINALAEQQATPELAPAYQNLQFQPPIPGSYALPVLGQAGDGTVLTSDAQRTTLHQLYRGKVVLLSFIYSACSDVNGCPLATMVLHKIKARLAKEPELQKQLRLLTLSFNPEHDTPERMRVYGENLQGDGIDWQFLTTQSEQELEPILARYPQNIQKVYDAEGKFTGTFNHDLRVYLIDSQQQIRNIYSVTFLHPDTLINDLKTVLLNASKTPETLRPALNSAELYQAGDNKTNYASADYQTHSIALLDRKGQALDLLQEAQRPQLGLPPVPTPEENPLTDAKIQLGRKLFYDRRLSLNNTFSCAMCHVPEQGFTSNEMATSVGIEGRTVRRNAPTIYNVGFAQKLFHDGRETTLEQQVWGPLLAANEMANPSIGQVIAKLKQQPDYQGLFEHAFDKPATMETIGMALASYERALNSADSAFDRWYFGKEADALTPSAQRGFELFRGKANCTNCHQIGTDQALFTDQQLHNTGIGYQQSMHKTPTARKVQVAPGVFVDIKQELIQSVAETKANDLGYYEVTQNPAHRWQYKTPSLRNVSLTAPYMHNGSLATLEEVVQFYNQGGFANENLDPLIRPLGLKPQEIADLIDFLSSLTGSNVKALVADAFAAPIGDSRQ